KLAAGLVGVVPPQIHPVHRAVDVAPRGTDVMAGGEVLAGPTQQDHLDRVVIHGTAEGGIQGVGHLSVLGIVEAGPVHGHQRYGALDLVEHRLVGLVDRGILTLDEFAAHAGCSSVAVCST